MLPKDRGERIGNGAAADGIAVPGSPRTTSEGDAGASLLSAPAPVASEAPSPSDESYAATPEAHQFLVEANERLREERLHSTHSSLHPYPGVRERWASGLDSLLDEISEAIGDITRVQLPTDDLVHLSTIAFQLAANAKHLNRLCRDAERLATLLDDTDTSKEEDR